ncbi:MAG TPA: tetratricopeptide repeat protein, partial [bacterium]|nr:tetratricopeptide repeat protein [bacterium]
MVKRLATLFLLSLCCVSLSAQENQDYQFALGLFKDGMYELAAAELRKVISQLPEEEKEKPRYYLAETLFRLNKSDEALLEWKSLVDGKNLDIREKSLLRFADSHYSLKHYAEAITAYTDYLARYPAGEGREDALLFLSEAAYKKGDSAKALSRLKEYLKKFPQGKYADYVNFLGGKIAFSQGSYQESRDFLKKLKPGSSLEQEGKFILGTTLLKLNRYEEARSTFKELAEKFKGSDFEVRSLLRMGDSYFREKKYDAAREQYKKIKQLTKNKGHLSEALYLTAETYYDQGLWNQAYLNYDQAVTGFPESDFLEPSLFNMAWCWLKQDDYHRARKDFAKLVLKFPESAYTARTLFLLGHSYYMTQEYDQASEYYTRLLKAYPSDKYIPEAYYWLAETEYRRGKYARVGELAGTFLKKFPRHSLKKDIIIVAGEAALKGNEFQKALGFYGQLDKILSSKEKYIYYFYLGNAYFKKGSWPEAEKYLSLVAKEFPGSPLTAAALLNLGHLYLNRKEYDRSLQTYARIFELFPDDVMGREKAAYYTANVFYKKRSFAEAATAFLDFEAKFHDSSLVPEALFY